MLLQSYEERIYVLPAWPEEWDVDFCLNANYNTAVRLVYSGGQITTLEVESDDPDRVDDIIPPTISVSQTLEFEALDYSVSNPDMTIPPPRRRTAPPAAAPSSPSSRMKPGSPLPLP